jgi:DNA topoisomerase-1
MRVAQHLYEGVSINGESIGLITYMRTDSVNVSKEALKEFRKFIDERFGGNYLPSQERLYKTKTKNAQEAHEAIRPTSAYRTPDEVAPFLEQDQLAMYTLIWKRALASQMESAVFDQVTAEISDASARVLFRAVGSTQIFDGFLRLYQEGKDEEDEDEESAKLPILQEREVMALIKPEAAQHFTQPPPRFTEASLVKKLEELGIGRPSTYAPLMQVLQDREYATLEKRQFVPSDRGRLVTAFLTNFCKRYVEYDFTAHLEDELDDIADGNLQWRAVMKSFWDDFSAAITNMKEISITEVIDRLEADLGSYLFKTEEERKCQKCEGGKMGLRLSKFGAFLGCSNYPECQNRQRIGAATDEPQDAFEPIELGIDERDNSIISLRKGPYGFYLQFDNSSLLSKLSGASTLTEGIEGGGMTSSLHEQGSDSAHNNGSKEPQKKSNAKKIALTSASSGKGKKSSDGKKAEQKSLIKRIGLPAETDPYSIDLEKALDFKSLPKAIGSLNGKELTVNIGRFGPYVKYDNVFASIPKSYDLFNLQEDEAVRLIEAKMARPARRAVTTKADGKTRSGANSKSSASAKKTLKKPPNRKKN